MFNFFKCKSCIDKDIFIKQLIQQNTDLHNRVMSFNKEAFVHYMAETKQGKPLYPIGIDKDGKVFSHKDVNPKDAEEEIFRAFGEENFTVKE